MNHIKLFLNSFVLVTLMSCGNEDRVDVTELPDQSWTIQLNGEDFTLTNAGLLAYYDAFSGDLTVVGTKSNSTEERIVLTFSVENGIPFSDGQAINMSEGSVHSILYFDGQNNNFSSLFLEGTGTFNVEQYIESDSRNFLSGTVNGVLFNKVDSTSVTVSGSVAAKTF